MTASKTGDRPRVAVVHALGSASAATVRAAAGRDYDVGFVCDFDLDEVAADAAVLKAAGWVVDVTGRRDDQLADALAEHRVDAVTTFSESMIRRTAHLAQELGLPYHDPSTALLLTDKAAQRARLAQAGVDALTCVPLRRDLGSKGSPGSPASDASEASEALRFPAVVKPRVGAGSAHTHRVDSCADLAALLADLPVDCDFVVEPLLHGDPTAAGQGWGDYVSVETVHTPQGRRPVCVTGKFPLAAPFRETGMVLPCTLDAAAQAAVLDVEAAAVAALGVRYGVTHTELKLTPDGPRVIEVNGRLGGYVPEILRRATGINLVRAALAVAAGDPVDLPVPTWTEVTYQYFLTPAPDLHGALAVGLDLSQLAELEGVVHVDSLAAAGRTVDWRQGTQGHLGVVYGSAPSHAQVRQVVEAVDEAFQPALRAALNPVQVSA